MCLQQALASCGKYIAIYMHMSYVHISYAKLTMCVWHYRNLSDVDRDGFLNAAEFCVAMHLTKQYFDGTPLPKTLPLPLKLYAKQAIKLPVSNESQKDRCLEIFEQSKNYVHEGILEGKGNLM